MKWFYFAFTKKYNYFDSLRRITPSTYKQARSQDLEKGGGGYFERVRSVRTTLTRIFIDRESVSDGLSENWAEISRKARKLLRFFRRKLGGLQKKKKKKKRSLPKLRVTFPPKSEIQKFFRSKLGGLQKKKKVFTVIESDFSSNFASSDVWGGAVLLLGGYFQYFTKNRPQKHKKHAILHTSQANGGGSSLPRPPGYATAYKSGRVNNWLNFYQPQKLN